MRIDVHHYLHCDEQGPIAALFQQIVKRLDTMAHDIKEVTDDIKSFKQSVTDYIAGRDAADATLRQQLADAVAAAKTAMDNLSVAQADTAAANAAKDALQSGVDEAFAAAEEAKGLLTPPAPPVVEPPVVEATVV